MIQPDTKDWTWVLERPCPECGYVSGSVAPADLGTAIRANAAAWRQVLAAPGDAVGRRPRPEVWSALEYACHVRDVHEVFRGRVASMLAEGDAAPVRFANWDQDATAIEQDYAAADPSTVAEELTSAGEALADLFESIGRPGGAPASAWEHRGLRSDGSAFTVASLGAYYLHDVVHHLHDVEATG